MPTAESRVRIVEVLPDLLATYGDAGNAIVLHERLRRRGFPTEQVRVAHGTAVPADGDVYVLGGGEDAAQRLATQELQQDRGFRRAVDAGCVVFAVCAGFQILGSSYAGPDGRPLPGLDVLDVTTTRRQHRAIGEVVARPVGGLLRDPLTGFENHRGATTLGPAAQPLGSVARGVGNGVAGQEGARAGHVIGSYLHGPALARNPELADLLLGWALGERLTALPMASVTRLRRARLRRPTLR